MKKILPYYLSAIFYFLYLIFAVLYPEKVNKKALQLYTRLWKGTGW